MVKWRGGRRSGNVIDIRGNKGKVALGCGPILLILVGLLFGVDPGQLLALLGDGGGTAEVQTSGEVPAPGTADEASEFVRVILADTEDTWVARFREAGATYREPELVLFSGTVQSACGRAGAATGPFYCPTDGRVYLDLAFFQQLRQLGASGDFAVAYVIAHEIGHHVQNLQGTLGEIQRLQQRLPAAEANQLSVRTELQADCYAGLWAHYAEAERDRLEAGDVQEGLDAAAAVGDDYLQQRAGQAATPDSFTHGTSEQRMQWFRRGLETGSVDACDTFADLR